MKNKMLALAIILVGFTCTQQTLLATRNPPQVEVVANATVVTAPATREIDVQTEITPPTREIGVQIGLETSENSLEQAQERWIAMPGNFENKHHSNGIFGKVVDACSSVYNKIPINDDLKPLVVFGGIFIGVGAATAWGLVKLQNWSDNRDRTRRAAQRAKDLIEYKRTLSLFITTNPEDLVDFVTAKYKHSQDPLASAIRAIDNYIKNFKQKLSALTNNLNKLRMKSEMNNKEKALYTNMQKLVVPIAEQITILGEQKLLLLCEQSSMKAQNALHAQYLYKMMQTRS